MDKGVEQSINSRREALYKHYDLPPDARRKAEALFARMELFGQECRDQADFEKKFATQTLSREFNNLFVEFTAYVKTPEGTLTPEEQMAENAKQGARDAVQHQTKMAVKGALVRAMPSGLHRWHTRGVYNIPVLGDILSALNGLNILQRLFPRRRKKAAAGADNEQTENK